MSVIRPFRGIRYATDQSADLSTRLAPPYDVLDAEDKNRLATRDARNFVIVDLPHVPPKHAGPHEAYQSARRTLEAWLADGTLVRDERPGLYAYHQHYRHGGADYVRKMFFARLRLEPFGAGSVYPHEQTFGGPKEDRLRLTQATRCNLSPIFGLFEDPENEVTRRLESELPAKPLATGALAGVENRLWHVGHPATIEAVTALIAPKPTYIADGHHRYGTALMYREGLIAERGPLPDHHPANFILCVFCAMEDPGLLILPTHRVLPNAVLSLSVLENDPGIDVRPIAATSADDVVHALAALGPQAVAFGDAGRRFHAITPRDPDLLASLEPERSPAWRHLGLAFLHAYLLDRVVTPKCCHGQPPTIHYVKSAEDAVSEAVQTRGAVFLMQPTTMAEMRAVCSSGDLMPQKSTFFYPKLASGLVVNPLTD